MFWQIGTAAKKCDNIRVQTPAAGRVSAPHITQITPPAAQSWRKAKPSIRTRHSATEERRLRLKTFRSVPFSRRNHPHDACASVPRKQVQPANRAAGKFLLKTQFLRLSSYFVCLTSHFDLMQRRRGQNPLRLFPRCAGSAFTPAF